MENNTVKTPFRRLIYIPIIHTQADMGSLAKSVRETTIAKIGQSGWDEHIRAVDRLWRKIEEEIEREYFDYKTLRLYQDGLPVCGKEEIIVRELARGGSRNHQILVKLMDRGGKLMGAESAELLLKEYNLVKESLGPVKSAKNEAHYKYMSKVLLKKRDEFIAGRINNTLQKNETGILFLGMLHSLMALLDEDIKVKNLLAPVNKISSPLRGEQLR